MKTLTNLLFLLSVLFLSCTNLNHGNFNKRKYTRLKSIQNEISVAEVIPENTRCADSLSYKKAPTKNPIIHNQIADNMGVAQSANDIYPNENPSEPIRLKREILPLKKSRKLGKIIPQKEEIEHEAKPNHALIVAWLIYLFLLLAAIVLIYIGIALEMELILITGVALWPVLVIYGIILLKRIIQQKQHGESSLLKGMEISTRAIFISALCGFISAILLIFGVILLG